MPNGHGAVPRFGSPVILAGLLTLVYLVRARWPWLVDAGYFLAALFGWRLAFHVHMWAPFEYGAASSSKEMLAEAWRRFRIAAVLYAIVSVLIWFVLTRRA
jgi:hypothetical protein